MRRFVKALLLTCLVLSSFTPFAQAHDITESQIVDICNTVEIKLCHDNKLFIDYWLHFGDIPAYNCRKSMDKNQDGEISVEEEKTYLSDFDKNLLYNFWVTVDEYMYTYPFVERGGFRKVSSSLNFLDSRKVTPIPLKVNFEYELSLKETLGKQHLLNFYIYNILSKGIRVKILVAQAEEVMVTFHEGDKMSLDFLREIGSLVGPGDYRFVRFVYKITSAGSMQTPNIIQPGTISPTGVVINQTKDKLLDYLKREELPLGIILVALVFAFLWGAGHALQPGHGKTLVAAYLVGSKGTIWSAVLLGVIVTISHVTSVLIIGVFALVASQYVQMSVLNMWLGIASGLIIIIIGCWMFIRRLNPAYFPHHGHTHGLPGTHTHDTHHDHNHTHDHSHPHDQDHNHPHPKTSNGVSIKELLGLGISGGIVPCPTAIVVLMMAIAIKRITWGLVLILSFSIGLAAVLIVIGILMVTASSFLNRFSGAGKLFRILSIGSSLLIIVIGFIITVKTMIDAGIISINI